MPRIKKNEKMSKAKASGKSSAAKASKAKGKASGNKKTAPASDGQKKKFKWRPGTVALREVKRYQKKTDLLLLRAPFQRVVREIAHSYDPEARFSPESLHAIQEAAEMHIVSLMEDSQLCAIHANKVTVTKKDLLLARRLRGD